MSEWISVEERLPDHNVCVDAWGTITAGYHVGDEGRYENIFYDHEKKDFWMWLEKYTTDEDGEPDCEYEKCYFGQDITFSHWMNMPPPPTNEGS